MVNVYSFASQLAVNVEIPVPIVNVALSESVVMVEPSPVNVQLVKLYPTLLGFAIDRVSSYKILKDCGAVTFSSLSGLYHVPPFGSTLNA